ncbi:MAG: hypothetical protein H0X24_21185 [Ktedonobacterales bacterium]|nr:hypothetical protein [Ktedonobacterales bacterium]
MTAFTIIGVALALIAGFVNLGVGLLRRKHPMILVMRIAIGILSLAAAVAIIILKADNVSFATIGVTPSSKPIYLIMGLAIFVGATLMLPASVERNNLPTEEQLRPTPRPTTISQGESGVHMVKEDWMN